MGNGDDPRLNRVFVKVQGKKEIRQNFSRVVVSGRRSGIGMIVLQFYGVSGENSSAFEVL